MRSPSPRTSTRLWGLALALSVLVTGKDYRFTGFGAVVVVGSLLAFVVAAVLGLWANMMKAHEVSSSDTLMKMVREHWKDDEVDARNIVATLNIRTIDSLRTGSNVKVVWIKRAAAIQLVAVSSSSSPSPSKSAGSGSELPCPAPREQRDPAPGADHGVATDAC